MIKRQSEELGKNDLTTEQRIRVLGRKLVMAYGDHGTVLELGVEIAQISVGIDPNGIDKESPAYRAGAAAAYVAVSNSMLEMKPEDSK